MTIAVRPLVAADRAGWRPLWDGYLAFYRTAVADDVTDLTFRRLTRGGEPMGGFVATGAEGRIVGIVHWIDHRSCWTAGDYCYLQDLFVEPGLRGGGVGRALIEAVCAAATARGCSRVHWLTHETNRDAMHLYDKVADRSGFVQYRRIL
ncbi:MAG: GNAT family N-acetyltransferase [Rhodospirillales bacterium]|jgi:GNAT superfamily N-acetyltransferase